MRFTGLDTNEGELHVDCTSERCVLSGSDGFSLTINDDLTQCVVKGKAYIHTQHADATIDNPAATRVTIILT